MGHPDVATGQEKTGVLEGPTLTLVLGSSASDGERWLETFEKLTV